MNYYTSVLKNYAVFNGRTARKGFWMFALINCIISIVIGIVFTALGDKHSVVNNLYSLAVLVPSLAVGARRLHDINKSGWWQLISLIPVIGWIWIIVLFCLDSDAGDNRFGVNPKGVIAAPIVPPQV